MGVGPSGAPEERWQVIGVKVGLGLSPGPGSVKPPLLVRATVRLMLLGWLRRVGAVSAAAVSTAPLGRRWLRGSGGGFVFFSFKRRYSVNKCLLGSGSQ